MRLGMINNTQAGAFVSQKTSLAVPVNVSLEIVLAEMAEKVVGLIAHAAKVISLIEIPAPVEAVVMAAAYGSAAVGGTVLGLMAAVAKKVIVAIVAADAPIAFARHVLLKDTALEVVVLVAHLHSQ